MEVLYNHIGKNYDVTRQADLEIVNCLKRHLQVEEGLVLDVACGTGNYTVALKNAGLDMVGVDVSDEMIRQAQEKMKEINWNIADVKKLPFSSRTFKGATCILAIHHFDHLVEAFQEVYRVIDEGRFVIFTSSPEQMDRYWLKEYFPVA
ncbi:class I SAM-dependent methyltransferase [Caldalkalibacillus mannanilyticus]|uniref:class I SAM-dependent methyltransferase n=1 Tax=Caldalkalibacillus mannanilyticus TaxID=1418 RepID=UPI000A6D6942|nr:class I SAM-dependent methyltransferase [Caldalkalibacillus mannanilyticus]